MPSPFKPCAPRLAVRTFASRPGTDGTAPSSFSYLGAPYAPVIGSDGSVRFRRLFVPGAMGARHNPLTAPDILVALAWIGVLMCLIEFFGSVVLAVVAPLILGMGRHVLFLIRAFASSLLDIFARIRAFVGCAIDHFDVPLFEEIQQRVSFAFGRLLPNVLISF
jgi:hypothetical protein